MNPNDKIDRLEKELAALRLAAERADAHMALIIGMLCKQANLSVNLEASAILEANAGSGWLATIFERITEGQETIVRAYPPT